MSVSISLSVEVEVADADSEELEDALAEDLVGENNLAHLKLIIMRWARTVVGLPAHVEITVD